MDSITTASSQANLKIIFVIGAPGAGKGTQCKLLSERYGLFHFSVGDYLRELADLSKQPTEDALGGISQLDLKTILEVKDSLPDDIMLNIVKHKLGEESAKGQSKILIDGFPRSDNAAGLFEEIVCQPVAVLFFACEKEVAKKRFLRRERERNDDEQAYEKRYRKFDKSKEEILRRYGDRLKTVHTGGSEEEAYQDLLKQTKSAHIIEE